MSIVDKQPNYYIETHFPAGEEYEEEYDVNMIIKIERRVSNEGNTWTSPSGQSTPFLSNCMLTQELQQQ